MVQHQVDDHTGNGDIEPKRKCPARDPPMSDEIAARRSVDGNQYQGHYNDRQNNMADENGEIKGPDNSLPQETRVAVVVVIGKIGSQEDG